MARRGWIVHIQYPIKAIPQIPSIRMWRPGGSTSEDPPDTDEVHGAASTTNRATSWCS
jgi:hypothetical protein